MGSPIGIRAQGLLPLAGEPLWNNLPSVWPETGADGTPDLDTVAEWLAWFGDDAQIGGVGSSS